MRAKLKRLSKQGKLVLNLGCGSNKIKGALNIDKEKSCKPDMLLDFAKDLPFPNDFVDKIFFFHVIEHIKEVDHLDLLKEFRRVLKKDGQLYISYPEFVVCAKNYIDNVGGHRDFWRNTIFGRQLYPSDYHIALMDSRKFVNLLDQAGFGNILVVEESKQEPYNSLAYATKIGPKLTYEDTLNLEIFGKQTLGAE
jgi:predicted SAM-dependent methyltransferase